MVTAYFSSILEDSVEIFFIDVTCIVVKAATCKTTVSLIKKKERKKMYVSYNIQSLGQ